MKLVSYNIQFGRGRDRQIDLARIAAAVDGADVVALQEVERFFPRSGMADQPAVLASLLPAYHWVYGPGLDMDAGEAAPEGRPTHRRRQFGNMLLSRRPIVSSRNHLLPKYASVKQYSLQRAMLEGVIDTAAGPLRFNSLHLTHVDDGTRSPQVDAILAIHARAPAEGGAWCGTNTAEWTDGRDPPPMPRQAVLMGDFNMTWSSPLYDRIVGPTGPLYGRNPNLEGFVDAWVAAGRAEDEGVSCMSDRQAYKRIDYCFVSTALAPRIRRAWIDGEAAGSDHQPIWTEIDL